MTWLPTTSARPLLCTPPRPSLTSFRRKPASSVPGMGMNYQSERRLPEVVTTTVVKPKARPGDWRAGRRVNQRDDRTNRNGQRGLMRAMSVLENTKSDDHRKAHGVQSGGPARKFMHLTRGDLRAERRAEVSRSHSSEEGRESGWSEGRKAQRDRLAAGLWRPPERCLTGREQETAAGEEPAGGFRRASRPGAAGRRQVEGCE